MRLLSIEADAKTVKGQKKGFRTAILYLAPANESKVIDTCPSKTPGCTRACLYSAGRAAIFKSIKKSRVRKTKLLAKNREKFIATLRKEIASFVKSSERKGLIPCVRINGTTDIPALPMRLASELPTLQFYDYTKIRSPWLRVRPNYSITYSLAETEESRRNAIDALRHGINVSVVFHVKRGQPLPASFTIPGDSVSYPVIDADETDLRFTDPQGVICGLRAKGPAKCDTSGFVQLVHIQPAR